jgi:EpsD family peptidyl-prolyl cis-trans isomerase
MHRSSMMEGSEGGRRRAGARTRCALFVIATGLAVGLLAGCGARKDRTASQTAAKVNRDEITVHQINFLLNQQRPPPAPQDAASASHQALERLIDQQLTIDRAEDQRLDRDPNVVQQIEASRREIISRAYLQKVSDAAPRPTAEEIRIYYDAHPALFKDRRIYNLQEVDVQATPAQVETLKAAFPMSKSFADYVAYLNASGLLLRPNQGLRSAEELPLANLAGFAAMKDGESMLLPLPGGIEVVHMVASRPQPLSVAQASPAIEQFLRNERRREIIASNLQALRGAAKIEYVGNFSESGAKPAAPEVALRAPEVVVTPAPAPAPVPAPPPTPTPEIPAVRAAIAQDVAPSPPINAASMPSRSILDKGLRGLN